ncbi:hypothetical protein Cni_G16912 [Canna indica]|uniref:Uncharacterized protein n=1 Tax=Canna indica TaxID=4628 RepID=A0AAQ3QH94_9LILI|nr:hypothetical protein Cni_G16912 [Canna indica]
MYAKRAKLELSDRRRGMAAPLPHAHQRRPPHAGIAHPLGGEDERNELPWLLISVSVFFTYNTITSICRFIDDPWAVLFIVVSYVDLVCLFLCLKRFERSDVETTKAKLKIAVWILASLLTGMFSYKVAAIMPLPAAVLVWCMGSVTTVGGFYAFFVYREPLGDKAGDGNKL